MSKKAIEVDPYASVRCCTRDEAVKITDSTKKLKGSKLNIRNTTIKYNKITAREVEQALYDAAIKNGIGVNISKCVFIAQVNNDVVVKF